MYKQASLILTENCNFNCPFCFEGTHKNKARNMSDETFDKIVEKLKKENVRDLVLFGGEPLVNFTPHMRETLTKEKDSFSVWVYTNGSLLTDELIEWFKTLPHFRINISCHNKLSIQGAERVAKKCNPRDYSLFIVCDEKNFEEKFSEVEYLLKDYGAHFALQTIIPDFNFDPKYTEPIYDRLVPYKLQLTDYDLFCGLNTPSIKDGSDDRVELIFTYDGRISLGSSTRIDEKHSAAFPLETPIEEVIKSPLNPNNVKIDHFPWQCEVCPIKEFPKASCPYAWNSNCHDFTLCLRQLLVYAICNEKKELLKSPMFSESPVPMEYNKYNHHIRSVMLNMTDQCNFRCRMCFCNWQNNWMTKEIADRGIELALSRKDPQCEKITVVFFGGEPMLNYELIQYVVKKWSDKCEFSMTTNGSLLTDERLAYLKEHDVRILLSIDGDKETQDYNRPFKDHKGSTFDVLEDKLPKILEAFPGTVFRSTVIPATVHLLHHNYTFAKEKGFHAYFCTPDAYSNWSPEYAAELKRQTSLIALDVIRDIYEGNPTIIPSFFGRGVIDFLRVQDNLPTDNTSPMRCGMGVYGIGVGATGIISACQEHSTISEGDMFVIGDVWNGIDEKKHLELLNKYHKERVEWQATECLECPLRTVCLKSSCPSRQGFMSGSFKELSFADCLWTQCCYNVGALVFSFFSENFSVNFETYLENLLEMENLNVEKDVSYRV